MKPRQEDKLKIWSAITGHYKADIFENNSFNKAICDCLLAERKEKIGDIFEEFNGFKFTLKWINKEENNLGIVLLLTFKSFKSIKESYNECKAECDKLWKFLAQDKDDLFWSMCIYYTAIKTTGVKVLDEMWMEYEELINKLGFDEYINNFY